jgi:hypothetical protein
MGDGSNALRYFPDRESAEVYMERNYEDTCYEDNPHHIRVDENFKFTEVD